MVAPLLRAVAASALAASALAFPVVASAPAQASPAQAAPACSDQATTFKRQLSRSANVFVGTIDGRERQGRTVTYSVAVSSVFAGDVRASPVEVTTSTRTQECGLPDLAVGDEWLLLTGRGLTLASTSGSGPADQAKLARAEKVLGAPEVIAEPEPERDPLELTRVSSDQPLPLGRLVAPGGAAFLVGLLGWLAVRRAGRRA